MELDGDESAGREAGTEAAQDVIRDRAATQGWASDGVLYTHRGVGGSDATKRQKRQSEKSTTCVTCPASLRTKR